MALTKKEVKKIAYYMNMMSEAYYYEDKSQINRIELLIIMEDLTTFCKNINLFMHSNLNP